jgi:uncharacterized protein YbjQ (UPF0145 family)
MTDKKKDLTRIEDLGEYLHEINSEEPSFETSFDTPVEEVPAFETTSFDSPSEEEVPAFEEATTFEGSATFETEETIANPVEEVTFLEAEPEPEPTPLYAPPEPIQETAVKAPETFEEVKRFAENTSFTGMATEGNPSFSVLLKNIRYVEDVNDILSLLKELGLLSDSEEQTRLRLMKGHLLVPRISEYAAIFLAHKLRRFDIDIQLGPSDEIHPPKHHEAPEVGLVAKSNLHQNLTHHFEFDRKLELSDIIVSATSTLEGHQVLRYLGVASEHKMLEGDVVEDETSDEIPQHYHELAQKLKAHALRAHANAVVGLNYQLTPLPGELGHSSQKYRLTCTGNLVWVNRL